MAGKKHFTKKKDCSSSTCLIREPPSVILPCRWGKGERTIYYEIHKEKMKMVYMIHRERRTLQKSWLLRRAMQENWRRTEHLPRKYPI